MIAWLGTGLLGSNFVRAARTRGEDVAVWNRTAAKAEALAETGARIAADPAEAVRGAERVHLTLLDAAAVDEVIERLRPGLAPGAVIIDHSTTATQLTAVRAERLAGQGIQFLHAPVFMGPVQALNAQGTLLVAGPVAQFEHVRSALERMTGKIRYMGERPDLAAAYKLFGNMMIMFVSAGLGDVFELARAVGVEPRDAYTIFEDFNPAAQVTTRGKRMAEGDFAPTFELTAARKDVRLMLDSAAAGGAALHVLPAIAERFDRIIAAGHGAEDLAAVGRAGIT